jgi:hypothetical protein
MPRAINHPLKQPIFHEPAFGEGGTILPDPNHFATKHLSSKPIYDDPNVRKALYADVVPFERSALADGDVYPLENAFGSQGKAFVDSVSKSGKIIFHCLGDTGATEEGIKYRAELVVSDSVSAETRAPKPEDCAAFMFHLGDVVYDFGESEYYYDQFYHPFRNYARPIFAIPGNHDSFMVPGTDPAKAPLLIFKRNFCSPSVVLTAEARSLHRTAMTQPGVYFTLDAPFVRIIGLFSNALEDPGIISSENVAWPALPDFQLDFLRAQLTKIRDDKYPGAVLIAVHHPPFSFRVSQVPENTGSHGGSSAMLRQIDSICKEVRVYPHAFLSGHAHNYQRFTRTVAFTGAANDYQVPFIICGNSGHNCSSLIYQDFHHVHDPQPGADVAYLEVNPAVTSKGLTIESFDDYNFGYLRVVADQKQIAVTYNPIGNSGGKKPDTVIVELATHRVVI